MARATFKVSVFRRRPYLQREWCIHAIEQPVKVAVQADGRVRFWCRIDGRFLRVITLEDRMTIHNAFFDRGFTL